MQPLVSIVIVNFNYSAYLATAVRSALGQSYRRIQIIVVDDGSTDGSASVMAGFGSLIQAIYESHQGPNIARNRGYADTSGDIVMFLDADDALHPHAVEEVVRRWRPGLSKVQFRLSTIDANGKALNFVWGFPTIILRSECDAACCAPVPMCGRFKLEMPMLVSF